MNINYEMILIGAVAIVGLSDWLKAFDGQDKLKKFYNLLPLIIAVPVAIIMTVYQKDPWYLGFMYWAVEVAVAVLAYNNIIATIKKFGTK